MIKTWRNNAPGGIGSGVSSSYGEITYLKGIHHHDHDVTSDVLSLIDDFVSNFAFSFSMTREPSARDRGAYQIGWKHFFRHVTQSRCLSSTPLVRGKKERQLSKQFSTLRNQAFSKIHHSRGLPLMTSAKISDFLTPPVCKFMQPL